jgi:hypothetical protein
MNFRSTYLFVVIQILILFSFENCLHKKTDSPVEVSSASKLDTLNAVDAGGGTGNGGGYDGKLTFVINYKEKLFYDSHVKMFSGETMSFTIDQGVAPYTYQVNGTGVFDSETLNYTTGYFETSPIFEKIIVTDSNGQIGTITVEIHSFLGKTEVLFPPKGAVASVNWLSPVMTNNKGDIYQALTYQNWRGRAQSVVRRSVDQGKKWTTILNFEFLAQVFIDPFSNELFIVEKGIAKLFRADADGKNLKKLILYKPSEKANHLYINSLRFISENTILAMGFIKRKRSSGGKLATLVSKDAGRSWQLADTVNESPQLSSIRAHAAVALPSGEVFTTAHVKEVETGISTWRVRKSSEQLADWQDEFVFNTKDTGFENSRIQSMVVDKSGNIFISQLSEGKTVESNFNILKRDVNTKKWEVIMADPEIANGRLYLRSDNKLFLLVHFVPGHSGRLTNLFNSSDGGATWSVFSDFGNLSASIRAHLVFLKNNIILVNGITNMNDQYYSYIARSADGGLNWKKIASYKPKNQIAGDFISRDFIEYKKDVAFMVGYAKDPRSGYGYSWLVKKSVDNGVTWIDCDQYTGDSVFELGARPYAISRDYAGQIFVVGKSLAKTNVNVKARYLRWVVRKSVDEGVTWSTVENTSFANEDLSAFSDKLLEIPSLPAYQNDLLTQITEKRDPVRLGFSAQFISINDQGELFVQGTKVVPSLGESPHRFRIETVVKKSSDAGVTWIELDRFGNFTEPLALQSCFGNVLFSIVRDEKQNYFRRSADNGSTWSNISIPEFGNLNKSQNLDHRGSQIITRSIQCQGESEVMFFANQKSDDNHNANKVLYFYSSDRGVNWRSQTVDFRITEVGDFAINSFFLDGTHFWLAGSLYNKNVNFPKKFGNTDAVVIRLNKDFKEAFIVDQNSDGPLESSMSKISSCSFGYCAVGVNQADDDENYFSILRSIEKK